MNISPYGKATRVEASYREHPSLFASRRSSLDDTWPTPEVQGWLQDHGASWHVENHSRLVMTFFKADAAMLFKLTFA